MSNRTPSIFEDIPDTHELYIYTHLICTFLTQTTWWNPNVAGNANKNE